METYTTRADVEKYAHAAAIDEIKENDCNLRFQFGTSRKASQNAIPKAISSRSQNAILENQRGKHRKYLPFVFTEQGVSMLSAVLRSKTAIKVSIKIINAFVEMRHFIQTNAQMFARLDSVECCQIGFESETERNFEKV